MTDKQSLSKYVQEKLGHYVYALRDPRDNKVFYVGKGVGERVLSHANGIIENDDPQTMKQLQIKEIHSQGLEVESWIVQSDLKDDHHSFATESAVYGILQLLVPSLDSELFSLKNIVAPPTFREAGLIQVKEAVALYGEPVDNSCLPHNAMFIRPALLWRRGMTTEELWEVTRGWWGCAENRISKIRYVISIPNSVIRGIWEVPQNGWREQKESDRGYQDALQRRVKKRKSQPNFGFDTNNEVSRNFPDLINKSVEHLFVKKGSTQRSFQYLDDQRVTDLRSQGITPFWDIS